MILSTQDSHGTRNDDLKLLTPNHSVSIHTIFKNKDVSVIYTNSGITGSVIENGKNIQ